MVTEKDFERVFDYYGTHHRDKMSKECYEISKQASLDFATWTSEWGITSMGKDKWVYGDKTISTEELFELYKKGNI